MSFACLHFMRKWGKYFDVTLQILDWLLKGSVYIVLVIISIYKGNTVNNFLRLESNSTHSSNWFDLLSI